MTLTQLQQRESELLAELAEVRKKIAEIRQNEYSEKTGIKFGDRVEYRGKKYQIVKLPESKYGSLMAYPILKDGRVGKVLTRIWGDEIKKLES